MTPNKITAKNLGLQIDILKEEHQSLLINWYAKTDIVNTIENLLNNQKELIKVCENSLKLIEQRDQKFLAAYEGLLELIKLKNNNILEELLKNQEMLLKNQETKEQEEETERLKEMI